MLGSLVRRMRYWLDRRRLDADLREEMETHRQLREDALRRQGDDAPAAASRRAMGNITLAVEDTRGVWIWPWLESLALDIRHGLRSLLRQPTYTITALVTLAAGSGALAAAFALAHTVLLKATPYPNADRIVQVLQERDRRARSEVASVDIDALRRASSLEAVTFAYNRSVSLTGSRLPENARAIYTDRYLFPLLGTPASLGRWPSESDAQAGTPPIVLSHRLWQRRFEGRQDVVGTPINVNGRPHVVAAVMPPEFVFPGPYYVTGDLWIFRDPDHPTLKEPERPLLLGFALLKPHVNRARAIGEAAGIAAGMQASMPDSHAGVSLTLMDWAGTIRRSSRQTLLLLVAAAAVVFLIVCINLFNLLLCRGLDRASGYVGSVGSVGFVGFVGFFHSFQGIGPSSDDDAIVRHLCSFRGVCDGRNQNRDWRKADGYAGWADRRARAKG